jgi:hypothetical protein
LVEQLVDRSLPFQLAGLFAIHESTLCGLLAAKTKTREHPPALVLAVGHEAVIHHPGGETTTPLTLLLFGGPVL